MNCFISNPNSEGQILDALGFSPRSLLSPPGHIKCSQSALEQQIIEVDG
jgi:hypothetical protein